MLILYIKKKCQKKTKAIHNSFKNVTKKKKRKAIEKSKSNKTEIMTVMKIGMMKMGIVPKKWKANGRRLRNLTNVSVFT